MRALSALCALALAGTASLAQAAPMTEAQAIAVSVKTRSGDIVCNPSAAFSQIPGQPDLFLGRGTGVGTLDYCHQKHARPNDEFLALYRMDWAQHTLVMETVVLQPPVVAPGPFRIASAIDPSVARFDGRIWVAFECTTPGAVSSCVAPLSPDLRSVEISKLSVAALGLLGPDKTGARIVAVKSASSPTLLAYKGKLYLYWQIDYFDNKEPENRIVTRGMELKPDSHGRMWGVGSGGQPVKTDDPRLSALAHDVAASDATADHVAGVAYAGLFEGGILEIASVGGTAGPEICRSTHDRSDGCWRPSISLTQNPLGPNAFGKGVVENLELPANPIEYPKIVMDPSGKTFLMGYFAPALKPVEPGDRPLNLKGLQMIPFDLGAVKKVP